MKRINVLIALSLIISLFVFLWMSELTYSDCGYNENKVFTNGFGFWGMMKITHIWMYVLIAISILSSIIIILKNDEKI